MPTKRLACILLFCTIISQSVSAKIKLFPGYYIEHNGDSVFCKIEFSDWSRNPKTIVVEVNNSRRTLSVTDINGFGVTGYDNYKTATVSYHTNPITGLNLPQEFSDGMETKNFFLKILAAGPYALYELVIPERPYYFISENEGAITELVYRVKQKELSVEEDQQYKKTLFGLFAKEGIADKNLSKINAATYSSADIGSLVNMLNENHTGIKIKRTAVKALQVDVFLGGRMNTFPSEFTDRYSGQNKMNSVFSFAAGINLLYTLPNHFKSFAVGLSAGYGGYHSAKNRSGSSTTTESANYYYTTTYSEKLSTTNAMVQASVYALYYISQSEKCKFYVKAGVSSNLAIGSDINVRTNYKVSITGIRNGNEPFSQSAQGDSALITINKAFINLNAGLGVNFGRHAIEFDYYTPATISSVSQPNFKLNMIGFYYYYTLFK